MQSLVKIKKKQQHISNNKKENKKYINSNIKVIMYVCIKTRINAEIHIIDKYLKMHSSCDVFLIST